jgi:hypothetical protein
MSSPILPAQDLEAATGGPPQELLEEIVTADEVAVQLRDSGYQLRFFPGGCGERTRIEIHDDAGEIVSALSAVQAVALAVAVPID